MVNINRNNALSNRGVIFRSNPGCRRVETAHWASTDEAGWSELYTGDRLFRLFYQVEIRYRQLLQ
jgi:hypothetical protein